MLNCADYAALPAGQRERALRALNCLEAMPAVLPCGGAGGRYARLAAALGMSQKQATKLYCRYVKAQDWRVFVDRRKAVAREAELPLQGVACRAFADWLAKKVEANQRSTRMALKEVVRVFMTCPPPEVIPGFEQHPGGFLPEGCSMTSLRARLGRVAARSTAAAVRYGLKATAAHRLSVFTTRRGVLPGQCYEFDDVWHDHLVVARGQMVRVLEFGCLDLASGCRVHWGHIPALKTRTETREKRDGLTKAHFMLFLAYVLRYIGYHPAGCVLKMEHHTATVDEQTAAFLEAACPGLRVERGGIIGTEQRKLGGYAGNVGGNPRRKAAIESSHNGLHNFLATLPGQVGPNRQQTQEATIGRQKEQQQVERWRERLVAANRPDLAEALSNHFLTMGQFSELLLTAYRIWNSRRDHDLEGWQDRMMLEYRVGDLWYPAAQLTEEQRAAVAAAARSGLPLVREVRMSPMEVWEAGRKELRRCSLGVYVELLRRVPGCCKRVKVYGGTLRVQDKVVAPEPLYYRAEMFTPLGRTLLLGEDEEVELLLNPYGPRVAAVLDPQTGEVLGECPQIERVGALDRAAIEQEMGRVAGFNARRLEPQRIRWEADTELAAARREHNRALAVEGGAARVLGYARPTPRPAAPQLSKACGVDVFGGLGELPPAGDACFYGDADTFDDPAEPLR